MTAEARVRVLVHMRADPAQAEDVHAAYDAISASLEGTPGLLGNELLHAAGDPCHFAVLSEWESLAAFRVWEGGSVHRRQTAPLRVYLTGATIFEVEAAY